MFRTASDSGNNNAVLFWSFTWSRSTSIATQAQSRSLLFSTIAMPTGSLAHVRSPVIMSAREGDGAGQKISQQPSRRSLQPCKIQLPFVSSSTFSTKWSSVRAEPSNGNRFWYGAILKHCISSRSTPHPGHCIINLTTLHLRRHSASSIGRSENAHAICLPIHQRGLAGIDLVATDNGTPLQYLPQLECVPAVARASSAQS